MPTSSVSLKEDVARYSPEVVATYDHDPTAFTQGLIFHQGILYESTGLYGQSSLRKVELRSGRVLKKVPVSASYFAEGLAIHDGKLYQLTWQAEKGFMYRPENLEFVGEWSYEGEGWGLTSDGKHLIMSDGTDELRFIDPRTFAVVKTLKVRLDNRAVTKINELEFVGGEIYANVWQENRIMRIDASSGNVKGIIDCDNIVKLTGIVSDENVLNGIAYDAAGDRLFLTGKRWAKLYEVRLVKR